MNFWTLDRIFSALGRKANESNASETRHFSRISTDSRRVDPGDIFVALVGQRYDGHEYVRAATEKGAAVAIVSRHVDMESGHVAIVRVPDTLVALGQLASFWRRHWGGPVVMVTGSNGKTTTKDLIRAALSRAQKVHATVGNLNNRIGVPLTLLSIPADADIAVVEAGTNMPGEVGVLREISDPDISVVTSVAEEHLEGLGDLEGVLREETACYDGVRIAIAPSTQPEVVAAAKAKAREVISAGLDCGDVKPRSWTISPEGVGVLELDGVTVTPPLRGLHNLRNAMLAIAVARSCGVSDEVAAAGINEMPPPKMRVAWENAGSVTIINDAYNANPGSTRAAIELLRGVGNARQRVIVLGTMRELGAASAECHDDITRLALGSGADVVAGVGDFADSLCRVGTQDARVVTAKSVAELWPLLEPLVHRDAVILLKASRGVELEQLVPHITTWANS